MTNRIYKLVIVIVALAFFITAFVLNITSDQAICNEDLNIVPQWQSNTSISSEGFMFFMNLISVLFDPPVCAAYLAALWLFSARRLEIMVFLLWFIFMSWVLSVMKCLIQQPRPFWIPGSAIQMQSWTCYTEYGCPSGHSWMGLVIFQFLVRFLARGYEWVRRHIIIGYILIIIFQATLMFSRVILGMHTFNEVLMGAMMGLFSILLYYSYAQNFTTKLVGTFINSKYGFSYFNTLQPAARKRLSLMIVFWFTIIVWIIDLVVYFVPEYNNTVSWSVIQATQGCQSVRLERSFQYRCLQDMGIMMAGVGLAVGLICMNNHGALVRQLGYRRFSGKHRVRLLLLVLLVAIPILALMNPLWYQINFQVEWLAFLLWAVQSIGFFFGLFLLIYAGPIVAKKCGYQIYGDVVYELPPAETNTHMHDGTKRTAQIQMNSSGDQEHD